jgi:cytochrome c peroxidase
MKASEGFVLIMGLLVAAGCTTEEATSQEGTGTTSQSLTLDDRITQCSSDPRVSIGILSLDSCVGGDLFFRETFSGNGRSCGTCHPVSHNFTIDPAFIATLPSTNPLFIAETNTTLANLEKPAMMRQFSLILENVDGFAPDPTTHFVLRQVPHTLSLATSITNPPNSTNPPANRTGWGGDGAPNSGALRDFQTGAITQHYTKSLARVSGTDFRLATDGELDAIDKFMRQLGRLNDIDLTTVVMNDSLADAGRTKFLSVGCNACHGNAGANATFAPGNRNFNTGIEGTRNATLATFPRDGGFGTTAQTDGSFGDRTFNTPPLIEAADTGPFFHTATTINGASAHNVAFAQTIEEAVAFYNSPAFLGGPFVMTAQEIDNIGRALRVLNAAFNIAIAQRRIEAVGSLLNAFPFEQLAIEDTLKQLAAVEAQDAVRVLSAVSSLNLTAQSSLNHFISLALNTSGKTTSTTTSTDGGPTNSLDRMRLDLATAAADLGTNMTFQIGDGMLMF